MTASQWETAGGIALLITGVILFIVLMSIFDSRSRRERGLPKKTRKKNGRHEG